MPPGRPNAPADAGFVNRKRPVVGATTIDLYHDPEMLAEAPHAIPDQPGEITWGGLANTQWLAVPDTGMTQRTALFGDPPTEKD